jgi:integrase
MIVKKRCSCAGNCEHHYHFSFKHSGLKVPHRESTHTKNYKLAVRIADRRKDEIIAAMKGVGPVEPITVRLSTVVGKFSDWYKAEYPKTFTRISTVVASLQASFAPVDPLLVDVTPFDLQRWRTARLTDHKRSSVQREYIIVRSLLREAETWYRGFVSPARKVPLWKLDDVEIYFPTEDEVAIALKGLPPRYAMFCEVTLETLARLSEVLSLTRRDLGAGRGPEGETICWLWRRLKGGQRMRVQISEALYLALQGELTRPGQDYLFETQSGTRVHRRDGKGKFAGSLAPVNAKWKPLIDAGSTSSYFTRLFKGLGIPRVHHHSFRHLGITMMLDRGVNNKAIMRLAGWKSLRMLEKYGHVRDAEMHKATTGNATAVQAIKDGQRTQVALLPAAVDEAVAK